MPLKWPYRKPDTFDFYRDRVQNEADLLESLMNEVVEKYGIPAKYLPATRRNVDQLLGDNLDTIFDTAVDVVLLTPEVNGYVSTEFMFNKFGLTDRDEITFTVVQTQFDEIVGQVPEVGDLIYPSPIGRIYEVKFVEDEGDTFLTLGRFLTYQFLCRVWIYSHEDLQTGVPEVDQHDGQLDNLRPGVPKDDDIANEKIPVVDYSEDDPFGELG